MRIKNREISLIEFPSKAIILLKILFRLHQVKHPLTLLRGYIQQNSPRFIELKNGLKIKLSSHPHDITTFFVVFLKKDYGNVKKGTTVVDIGANIGVFSLFAAKSGAREVYAFEPSKEAFETLCENIKINQITNIIAINQAVTDGSTENIPFPVNSSPYNSAKGNNVDGFENYYEVRTTTIDNFIADQAINSIDLLKMDCEGSEFEIIPSISSDGLKKIKEIRMELHGNGEEILQTLSKNGYIVNRVSNNDVWLTNHAKRVNSAESL